MSDDVAKVGHTYKLSDEWLAVNADLLEKSRGTNTPVDRLERVYELVDTADWQSRASDPNRFAAFCAEILRAIDIDSLGDS